MLYLSVCTGEDLMLLYQNSLEPLSTDTVRAPSKKDGHGCHLNSYLNAHEPCTFDHESSKHSRFHITVDCLSSLECSALKKN